MGWMIGVATILTMVLLRVAVPLAVILLFASAVRSLYARWEKAAA